MMEPIIDASMRPTRKPWKRIVAGAVVLVSLGWALLLVRTAWSEFASDLARLSVAPLGCGVALSLSGTLLSFFAFARLFAALNGKVFGIAQIAHFHFAAQLIRHLPGRFFGFAYQVAATRGRISAAKWIAVNGVHTALNVALGMAAALTIVVARRSALGATVIAIGSVLGCFVLWTPTVLHRVSAFATKLKWPIAAKFARLADALAQFDLAGRISVVTLLVASWLVYFAAWGCYGVAYPGLSFGNGVMMCAIYSVAWLAGYLSLVTPSGLGVRELAFAAMAHDFSSGAIAYGIVVGRLSLLLTDVLLGVIFLFHGKREHLE
jgi:hypothetical protein